MRRKRGPRGEGAGRRQTWAGREIARNKYKLHFKGARETKLRWQEHRRARRSYWAAYSYAGTSLPHGSSNERTHSSSECNRCAASRGMLMTVREKGAERQKQEREEKTLGPSRSNEETPCYPAVHRVHTRALCAHCAFHFKLHTGA